MALELRKKRRKWLSMTSLIDVIFLLLLFFMLTSTFSKFGEVELAAASAGGNEDQRDIRFIKLEVQRILVDGKPVVIGQVAAALHADREQTALISLGPQATSQQLIDLLTVLKSIENLRARVIG